MGFQFCSDFQSVGISNVGNESRASMPMMFFFFLQNESGVLMIHDIFFTS